MTHTKPTTQVALKQAEAKLKSIQTKRENIKKRMNEQETKYTGSTAYNELQSKRDELQRQVEKVRDKMRTYENQYWDAVREDENLLGKSKEFGNYAHERAKEEVRKLQNALKAEQLDRIQTIDDMKTYATGKGFNVNNIYTEGCSWHKGKHGTFYKKTTLKNGITIYHNKADETDSWRGCNYNTYFAVKEGKVIGVWQKYKTRHPGDYASDAKAYIGKDRLTKKWKGGNQKEYDSTDVTYFDWQNALKAIDAQKKPTTINDKTWEGLAN